MPLCCRYHSVGYFVFARQSDGDPWEPVLEVPDQAEGAEVVRWLTRFPFAVHQLLTVANDN
ncbi:MAG TPA: hypothetical protein VG672_15815 [Bryobacteraceae bacterium]|jgi:hypothetical protein|nr:hypothetical protein [Bryobacteraceae bacterium]